MNNDDDDDDDDDDDVEFKTAATLSHFDEVKVK